MHYFHLTFGVMALAAERTTLGRQFEALAPLDRMLLDFLQMARKAILLFNGLVGMLQGTDGRMTGRRNA
jgi:hypothetical protein